MTWVKLDDQLPGNVKAVTAGPEAMWLWTCGLCYCSSHLTDGVIPKAALPMVSNVKAPKAKAQRLVEVGLWTDEGDHYRVGSYLDYQPSKVRVQSQRDAARDRQQKSRRDRAVTSRAPTRPDPDPSFNGGSTSPDDPTSLDGRSSDDSIYRIAAELILEAQAEPPRNARNFRTGVARNLKSEKADWLRQYRKIDPTADDDELARWLADGVTPKQLAEGFTPASDLRVIEGEAS